MDSTVLSQVSLDWIRKAAGFEPRSKPVKNAPIPRWFLFQTLLPCSPFMTGYTVRENEHFLYKLLLVMTHSTTAESNLGQLEVAACTQVSQL